ncbi:ribonuclease E/G [Catonella massiliensis]|uniref:Ribonuclease E/G n=1 Tax=Catonella massiliensis TaxID=2799636 RepID=A0ABS1IZ71_9FIRM|nr:ribonuclease E/G [Catonella massiliensis]MBK5897174.1 ribonuclease E/G [Catonella massiliensis]
MIRIISTKIKGRLVSALADDFDIKEFKISEDVDGEVSFNIGDIIVGRVENIVKNINACFVEIFPGIQAYLPLSDEMKIIYANGKPGGRVVVDDLILVQIAKLPTKTKSYSLTTDFTFMGKYAVLKPGLDRVHLSTKYREEENYREIRDRFLPVSEKFVRETGAGAIIRKSAASLSEKELEDALYDLYVKFISIINRGRHGVKYERIFKEIPEHLSLIRDNCSIIEKIMTDDEETYREYEGYLRGFSEADLKKLFFYKDEMMSLSALYSVNTTLEKALSKKVWLKSGAYIIIEYTEALTVVDVNSGKAVAGKTTNADTFMKINLEAAREIADQIRLRNLSGIILVDFIEIPKSKEKELIHEMENFLKEDSTKSDVADITKLGLMEITRRRSGRPIHEILIDNKPKMC